MQNPTVLPTESSGFTEETVCVPLTGVMIARAFDPSVPGIKAEVLALAVQMGAPNGVGANYTLLKPAMKVRYGLVGTVVDHMGAAATYTAVMAAAAAGPCVVGLAGDQAVLTPVWQAGNHVGHSIAVLYANGTTGIQLDPLAPAGYAGDPFTPAELAKFATAAIIFKAPEEESMPGFKMNNPAIGKVTVVGAGVALVSPSNPKVHYPQNPGSVFDVYASLDLKNEAGASIDIEGNSPAKNDRDKVYLVDMPNFGVAAYLLRGNGLFSAAPVGHSDADVEAARAAGRVAGIKAAADAAAQAK